MKKSKESSADQKLTTDMGIFTNILLREYGNIQLRHIPVPGYSTLDATQRYLSDSSSQSPETVIEEIETNKVDTMYPVFSGRMDYLINSTNVESGFYYEYEKYFDRCLSEDRLSAKLLLLKYARNRYDYIRITKAILHLISHYDYKTFGSDFAFFVGAALHHSNKGIRKFALKVFDNWDDVETIHILRGIEPMKESWLEAYRQEIIHRIENRGTKEICHITSEESTVKTGQNPMSAYQWMPLEQMH